MTYHQPRLLRDVSDRFNRVHLVDSVCVCRASKPKSLFGSQLLALKLSLAEGFAAFLTVRNLEYRIVYVLTTASEQGLKGRHPRELGTSNRQISIFIRLASKNQFCIGCLRSDR